MESVIPNIFQTVKGSFKDQGKNLSLNDPLKVLANPLHSVKPTKRQVDENRIQLKTENVYSLIPDTANVELERARLLKRV